MPGATHYYKEYNEECTHSRGNKLISDILLPLGDTMVKKTGLWMRPHKTPEEALVIYECLHFLSFFFTAMEKRQRKLSHKNLQGGMTEDCNFFFHANTLFLLSDSVL